MCRSLALVSALLVASAGCSSSLNTTTPAMLLSGTYSGESIDSRGETGTFILGIERTGSQISGRWGDAYPGKKMVNVGTLSGTAAGTALHGTATSEARDECSLTLSAEFSGSTLSGSYQGIGTGCVSQTGTFTLSFVKSPMVVEHWFFRGSVEDDVFDSGVALIDLGDVVPPFVRGRFHFGYKRRQDGMITGWVNNDGSGDYVLWPEKPDHPLFPPYECNMTAVATYDVNTRVLSGTYDAHETLGCEYGNRKGKFSLKREQRRNPSRAAARMAGA